MCWILDVDLSNEVRDHAHDQRFPAYLLLSWAGSSLLGHIDVNRLMGVRTDLEEQLRRIHNSGVLHQDAELRNLVISDGHGHGHGPAVMFADFERATILLPLL